MIRKLKLKMSKGISNADCLMHRWSIGACTADVLDCLNFLSVAYQ
ncbi:unnamed protein product [Trifolium pratense]|uniref:Uncharacterized protein n=1 Tax=Trifolium pratense TaxID=57577 RepID=A0ACB0LMM4_TRIPR|nr:unnamed protein product [Trifolium pratense]